MENLSRGRDLFRKFHPVLKIISSILIILPKYYRIKLFYILQGIKGKIGIGLRYASIKSFNNAIGDNVQICDHVYLFNPQNIMIGSNVSIHPMCYIEACGGIKIGNDVSIAHGTSLLSTNHNYKNHDILINDQGVELRKLNIADNVWIGAHCVILGGVTIASGNVIAAGSVVTKSTEADSIMAGVPAKKISNR